MVFTFEVVPDFCVDLPLDRDRLLPISPARMPPDDVPSLETSPGRLGCRRLTFFPPIPKTKTQVTSRSILRICRKKYSLGPLKYAGHDGGVEIRIFRFPRGESLETRE